MKYDFELDDKKLRTIVNGLEKWILENYGKPCKTYASGCSTCKAWVAFHNLKLTLNR